MTTTATPPAPDPSRERVLNRAKWSQVSGRAGQWRLAHLDTVIRPAELGGVAASKAIYVPLRQYLRPRRELVVDYVGSVSRSSQRAVWQRIVNEHQTEHLERLLEWDYVAVVPLRADTPTTVVRLIEAAVADAVGRPPKCQKLPRLPRDWERVRDAAFIAHHAQVAP